MHSTSPSVALPAEPLAGAALESAIPDRRLPGRAPSALGFGLGARLGLAALLLAVSWIALSWAMA